MLRFFLEMAGAVLLASITGFKLPADQIPHEMVRLSGTGMIIGMVVFGAMLLVEFITSDEGLFRAAATVKVFSVGAISSSFGLLCLTLVNRHLTAQPS